MSQIDWEGIAEGALHSAKEAMEELGDLVDNIAWDEVADKAASIAEDVSHPAEPCMH